MYCTKNFSGLASERKQKEIGEKTNIDVVTGQASWEKEEMYRGARVLVKGRVQNVWEGSRI